MKSIKLAWLVCLALSSMLTTQSEAKTRPAKSKVAVSTASTVSTASPPGFAKAVDVATLDTLRGGRVQVRNDMTLTGTTAGNTARNVNTGSNDIGSGAFSSMSGIPVVIQNSGANVLIQNAVILNLQMN